jgi:hypothetical protein
MSNVFSQNPVYIDADTTTGAGTNWRGTSGGSQFVGKIGIRPEKIVIGPSSTTATVAGIVTITEPNASQNLFSFVVPTGMVTPVEIDLVGAEPGWHDFVVTGATAAKVAVQIFYRV